ncbi:MAG: hypothetical protein ACKO8G_03040 [Actinomycetota bacterium]
MSAVERFPSLEARDLEYEARRVPDDLEGEPRVLLVAFDRFHQSAVDAWVEVLERDGLPRAPGMRVYEIPTIGTRWRWARGFIDGGMVAAIRDLAVRRRTLTIYTDVRRVLRGLGLPDASQVCAVVLAPDGSVRAKAVGPPSPERVATILDAL